MMKNLIISTKITLHLPGTITIYYRIPTEYYVGGQRQIRAIPKATPR